MNDFYNLFKTINKYKIFFLLSFLFFFIISIYLSYGQIENKKIIFESKLEISKLIFDLEKKFVVANNSLNYNLENKEGVFYELENKEKFDIINLPSNFYIRKISNGIKKDLKKLDFNIINFKQISDTDVSGNNYEFLINELDTIFFQIQIPSQTTQSEENDLNKIINNVVFKNLLNLKKELINNVNLQINLFEESQKGRMDTALKEINTKIKYYKNKYLENLNIQLSLNDDIKLLKKDYNSNIVEFIRSLKIKLNNSIDSDWTPIINFLVINSYDFSQSGNKYPSRLTPYVENIYSKKIEELEFIKNSFFNNSSINQKMYNYNTLTKEINSFFISDKFRESYQLSVKELETDNSYSRSFLVFFGLNFISICFIILLILIFDSLLKPNRKNL